MSRLQLVKAWMNALAFVIPLLALTSCNNIIGWQADENRIAGTYLLERVDGVQVPGPLPPQQGCNRTIRYGILSLSGAGPDVVPGYGWSIRIDVACEPVPPGVFGGVPSDVGSWRLESSQIVFRSSKEHRSYPAVVEEVVGNPPVVTFEHLGNTYRFKKSDDPTGVVFVKVIDQFGQPVGGVRLIFSFANGIERGGTTPADGEFGTGGVVGECSITMTPPAGYVVPPSQPNPFSVTVRAGPAQTVQATLTKL